MVLVGNKIDIKERSISREVGVDKARKMGMEYREVQPKLDKILRNCSSLSSNSIKATS